MDLRGTNEESGRPYRRRIVLGTIRLHAPVARAGISRPARLTVRTVCTITRGREATGFVRSARGARCWRGQPPTRLAPSPEGGLAIGPHVTPVGGEAEPVATAAPGREDAT